MKNLNPAPEREEEKVPDSIGENRAAIDPVPAQHRNLSRLHAGKNAQGRRIELPETEITFWKGKKSLTFSSSFSFSLLLSVIFQRGLEWKEENGARRRKARPKHRE